MVPIPATAISTVVRVGWICTPGRLARILGGAAPNSPYLTRSDASFGQPGAGRLRQSTTARSCRASAVSVFCSTPEPLRKSTASRAQSSPRRPAQRSTSLRTAKRRCKVADSESPRLSATSARSRQASGSPRAQSRDSAAASGFVAGAASGRRIGLRADDGAAGAGGGVASAFVWARSPAGVKGGLTGSGPTGPGPRVAMSPPSPAPARAAQEVVLAAGPILTAAWHA